MRIFYLNADPGIAPDGTKGASVHLRSIASALVDLGHDVSVFSRRKAADDFEPRFRLRPFQSSRDLVDAVTGQQKPDLIIERYSLGHGAGLQTATQIGCRFALEMNAPLVDEAARYRDGDFDAADARVEKDLVTGADSVHCVSEPLATYAAALRGTRDGVHVVRNGHDPALFRGIEAADPSALASRSTPARLAFLGHPKPWHGAERLPPLVARLRKAGINAELVVIGGGAGATRVRECAAREGIADQLIVTGALEQRDAILELSRCHVSLAPYAAPRAGSSVACRHGLPPTDGLFYFCPIKIIESMAAGLPVLAGRVGDIETILDNTGITVDPDSDDELFEAVRSLLRSPERLAAMSLKTAERARNEFSWSKAASAIVDHASANRSGVPVR